MSEKTNVGVLGQKYENRKTGKVGVLMSRNDEDRMLTMKSVNDSEFYVSYASFKSDWRKSAAPKVPVEAVSVDEIPADSASSTVRPVNRMPVDKFINFVNRKCSHELTADTFDFWLEEQGCDVQIFHIEIGAGATLIQMLPDVYTYSDFGNHIRKIAFDIHSNMSVTCITDFTELEEVLAVVAEIVRDINLYGYVVEEE